MEIEEAFTLFQCSVEKDYVIYTVHPGDEEPSAVCWWLKLRHIGMFLLTTIERL